MEAVEEHVVQSGKYAELTALFREKLSSAGWYDQVLAYASRELSILDDASAQSSSLPAVHEKAMEMMPEKVKLEMLALITQYVDEIVEKP